jgi:holin-like protein
LLRADKLVKVTMIKTLTFRSLYALLGFAFLVVFFLLGSWLHRLGLPIPGGVLGLLLFYLSMSTGLVKLKWVEEMAGLMLRHMVLLFVPLTVGLMEMGGLLSRQAVAITASLLVSLVAVLVTTGLLGRWLLPYDSATANDGTEASR